MDQEPKKSGWRWVWRIALWGFVLIVLAIAGFVGYFKTRPMPDPQKVAAADRRYREVRALFPDFSTTTQTITSAIPAAADSNSADTTASLQIRCDRLFAQLRSIPFDPITMMYMPQFGPEDIKRAKALAALYDLGIRVSPEARRGYKQFRDGWIIEALGRAMIAGVQSRDEMIKWNQMPSTPFAKQNPAERAAEMDRYIEALKFLRVANCPVRPLFSQDIAIRDTLMKVTGDSLTPLPAEYAKLSPELLAAREPLDWDYLLGTQLDRAREECEFAESLTHAGNSFQYFKSMDAQVKRAAWSRPILSNLSGAVGAIIGPPKFFAPALESDLNVEKYIQNYAAAYKKHELSPTALRGTGYIDFNLDQVHSRMTAGWMDLRRGAAVPTPDKIGPDSYFFDPFTQRPYLFSAKPDKSGLVRLSIRRPIAKSSQDGVEGREVLGILLPANHPGLESVPRM